MMSAQTTKSQWAIKTYFCLQASSQQFVGIKREKNDAKFENKNNKKKFEMMVGHLTSFSHSKFFRINQLTLDSQVTAADQIRDDSIATRTPRSIIDEL